MATLLVAAAGGHLEELWQLRPRLVPAAETTVTWVTSDTPQSRTLLAGEQRLFAPPARPRDAAATVANLRFARHVLALDRWTDIVSTGPLMAVPFMALGRAQGIRCHFIESPARVVGPSLSAKILERIPGIQCYSPYSSWRRPSWVYRGSVLDGYRPVTGGDPEIRRVVVTVGTSSYAFTRLFERLVAILPREWEVFWQTGSTDVRKLGIEGRPFVGENEMADRLASADVVIAHAGVGSALAAMRAGRAPILVPRRAVRKEHVDDHQIQIARELDQRGLATACEVDALDCAALERAAASRVIRSLNPPRFTLESERAAMPALAGRRATA